MRHSVSRLLGGSNLKAKPLATAVFWSTDNPAWLQSKRNYKASETLQNVQRPTPVSGL
jgi:hypothetical protein